jgi:putative phosphoribosyl transferase
VMTMNEDALARLDRSTAKQLEVIPRATHLFEEPGTLERVAVLASQWFQHYLLLPNSPESA